MSADEPTNGSKPSWRDLRETEARLMVAVKEHEVHVEERFDRAHGYHTDLNENIIREVDSLILRVDRIESVIDQLRGAKNLLFFAVGTNMLALIAFAYTIFIH